MNKTAIEWCVNPDGSQGFTWNPIVGCTNGCSYCYARRVAKRFKPKYRGVHLLRGCQQCYDFVPHLHLERLEQPLKRKKPATIFLASMSDLWDPNVPLAWRQQIWDVVKRTPQHTYLVLTKQPQNWTHGEGGGVPTVSNLWIGASLDGTDRAADEERVRWLAKAVVRHRFISCEPLLGPVHVPLMLWPDWVIIGAQTGPGARPPQPQWVDTIHCDADWTNVPVFAKDNLDWPAELGPKPRELPYLPPGLPQSSGEDDG